jgi:hypothetical protein
LFYCNILELSPGTECDETSLHQLLLEADADNFKQWPAPPDGLYSLQIRKITAGNRELDYLGILDVFAEKGTKRVIGCCGIDNAREDSPAAVSGAVAGRPWSESPTPKMSRSSLPPTQHSKPSNPQSAPSPPPRSPKSSNTTSCTAQSGTTNVRGEREEDRGGTIT